MTKIGTFENMAKFGHSKVHNYLFIKLFVVFFKNSYFFSIMYHILSPYRKYGDEIITKNGFECSWKTQIIVRMFTLKVHYYMIGVCLLNFSP
jgi:hypothetical protein